MNAMQAEVVVIGAGPAGIGAALALGERALVLERGDQAGGLAATLEFEGALFDLGGHSFHTPWPEVRRLVHEALPMQEQARAAWCYVAGEWIAYPFQQHYVHLRDAALVDECRAGLERARTSNGAPPHFDAWLEQRYGAGIARHFLRPYNEKLWGPDLSRLAVDWTAERVAAPAGAPEEFLTQGGARRPLQAGTTVAYPARGGYGEIFRALASRVARLRLGESVVRIDPRERSLATASGARLGWRRIVSTLPLPQLLDLLPDVPAAIRAGVSRLAALPLRLVLLALNTRLDKPMQRIYHAGGDMPGHKVVLNHNSSDWLRALPCHGVQVEVSCRGGVAGASQAGLCAQVEDGLLAMGVLAGRGQVAARRVIELPLGYPVPTHERAAIVAAALQWLGTLGIHSVGRFGEWAYINADEALHRGLLAGAALARCD